MSASNWKSHRRSSYEGRRHQKSESQIAGLYDLGETIGRGHFATVKLARHVFTGLKVAAKVIDKTKLDDISKAHLFQEVTCMKLVQHPNVVRLYEVIDTQTKLYLILELGDGGDMYDYIQKHENGLTEDLARRYFKQIVMAVLYCHKLHIVHRDLKPENVVFFEKLGIVKLTDFGFSNKFIPGSKLETSCGSLAYSAPEILLGDSYDAPAVDVWSLGVLLYMLVCGYPPFQEANDSETLTMIMDCKYTIPPGASDSFKALIDAMLKREPSDRATLDEILNHPWLSEGKNMPMPLLPLVCREIIPEEDQKKVINKMVAGKIATKEEILASLQKDSYDHISATFYLLAERRLRRHSESAETTPKQEHTSQLAPLALSPRVKSATSQQEQEHTLKPLISPPSRRLNDPPDDSPDLPVPNDSAVKDTLAWTVPERKSFQARQISLIKEESEDIAEEDEEEEEDMDLHEGGRNSRTSEGYTSDESDNRSNADKSELSPSHSRPTPPRQRHMVRPLHSVRSSPQLLNQIFEEGESEEEDDILSLKTPPTKKRSSPRFTGHTQASPEMLRKFEQQSRKKRLTSSNRGTSCSSSDASDTDEKDKRKRKEKLKNRFQRRDSSDHSSDTDGPSGPSGHGGGGSGGNAGSRPDRDHHRDVDDDHNDGGGDADIGGGCPNKGGGKENTCNIRQLGRQTKALNLQTDISRKLSDLNVNSGSLSPVSKSLTSFGSLTRSSKYVVCEAASRISRLTQNVGYLDRHSNHCINALNLENKQRSNAAKPGLSSNQTTGSNRIIHVRSKDFSDLVQRFKSKKEGNESIAALKEPGIMHKPRRRSHEKICIDLNRNGLILQGDLAQLEAKRQCESGVSQPTSKYCSVV